MASRVGIATGRRLSGRATRYQRKSPRWIRSAILVAFPVAELFSGDGRINVIFHIKLLECIFCHSDTKRV